MTPDIKNLMILPYTFVPDRFMVDVVDAEIADSDLSAAQAKFFRNNAENTLTFFVEYMKEKGFVFAAEAPKEDTSPPGAVDQHVMSRSEAELAVEDFSKYLERLRKRDSPYVKVRRDLMIHLMEERLQDASRMLDHASAIDSQ